MNGWSWGGVARQATRGGMRAAIGCAIALGGGAVDAATAAAPARFYAGRTEQHHRVQFDVVDSQVKRMQIDWSARCDTHQTYSNGTMQANARIVISHGHWRSTGGYRGLIIGAPKLTGVYEVLENRGRLIGSRKATGRWRLKMLVYDGAQHIDTCDTGVVTWTATLRP